MSKMLPAVNNTSPQEDWDGFTAGVSNQGFCPLTIALNLVVHVLGDLWGKVLPEEKSLFTEARQKSVCYQSQLKITRLTKISSEVWIQEKGTQVCVVTWSNGDRIWVHAPFAMTPGSAQINIKLLKVRMLFWKIPLKLDGTTVYCFCFCYFYSFLWEVNWRQNLKKNS